jgi:hypothetical protein
MKSKVVFKSFRNPKQEDDLLPKSKTVLSGDFSKMEEKVPSIMIAELGASSRALNTKEGTEINYRQPKTSKSV